MLEPRPPARRRRRQPHKRHPLDFVLWQPSAPDEPSWDTMWGRAGRAGTSSAARWRCASSGTTIDLHGGGTDLIFPHHECERAQSEAATGEPFVQHWMHTALISKDGEKMSKSLGNLVFVDALRKEWDPLAIRLGHHRAPLPHRVGVGRRPDAAVGQRLDRWRPPAAAPGDVLDDVRERPRRRPRHARRVAAIDAAAARGEDVVGRGRLLGVELVGSRRQPGADPAAPTVRPGDDATAEQARTGAIIAPDRPAALGHRAAATSGYPGAGRRSCARTTSRSSTRRS